MFQNLSLFPSSGKGGHLFCPLSDDGNRFSFRNFVFPRYLEFRAMDKVHNPSNLSAVHHHQNLMDSTGSNLFQNMNFTGGHWY
jgi:hypothetical protein